MRSMKQGSDGYSYYSDAYLWVPNDRKPSTWAFRYKTFTDGRYKVEWRQLGKQAVKFAESSDRAALKDIPEADQDRIKKQLYRLYRSVGVDSEDIPYYLMESTNQDGEKLTEGRFTELFDEVKLTDGIAEGTSDDKRFDREKGIFYNLAMLSPISKNNRRYAPPVIENASGRKVYENVPCFVDHTDKNNRKLRELAGTWKNTYWDSKTQRERGDLYSMRQHRELLLDVIENAPDQAAPSHVVQAVSKRAKDENGKAFEDITHIHKCLSVDIVVGAATIDNIMEGLNMPDWKDITLEDIKKSRLDLLVEHEKEIAPTKKEGGAPVDDSYKRLYEAEVAKREVAEAEAEKIKKEQEAEKKRTESAAHLNDALEKSPLNEDAKKALKDRLEGVELNKEQAEKVVADQIKLIETATGKELKKEAKIKLPKDEDGNKGKSDRNLLTEALCKSSGIEIDEKKQEKK